MLKNNRSISLVVLFTFIFIYPAYSIEDTLRPALNSDYNRLLTNSEQEGLLRYFAVVMADDEISRKYFNLLTKALRGDDMREVYGVIKQALLAKDSRFDPKDMRYLLVERFLPLYSKEIKKTKANRQILLEIWQYDKILKKAHKTALKEASASNVLNSSIFTLPLYLEIISSAKFRDDLKKELSKPAKEPEYILNKARFQELVVPGLSKLIDAAGVEDQRKKEYIHKLLGKHMYRLLTALGKELNTENININKVIPDFFVDARTYKIKLTDMDKKLSDSERREILKKICDYMVDFYKGLFKKDIPYPEDGLLGYEAHRILAEIDNLEDMEIAFKYVSPKIVSLMYEEWRGRTGLDPRFSSYPKEVLLNAIDAYKKYGDFNIEFIAMTQEEDWEIKVTTPGSRKDIKSSVEKTSTTNI